MAEKNIRRIDVINTDHPYGQTFTIGYPTYFEIKWADLRVLKSEGNLEPGVWYRIIDYNTIIVQTEGAYAGHKFDLLVQALSKNNLSEFARAMKSNDDTTGYFDNSNLEAWEIKYCIDNDTNRFQWLANNSMGVIYYMKDEFGNECPYDFKNVKYKGKKSDDLYTFHGDNKTDMSMGSWCRNNKITPVYDNSGKQFLNNIIFYSPTPQDGITGKIMIKGNIFGPDCHHIMLGRGCVNNYFAGGNSYIGFGKQGSTLYVQSGFEKELATENSYTNVYFGQGASCIYLRHDDVNSIDFEIKNVNIHSGVYGGEYTGQNAYTTGGVEFLDIKVPDSAKGEINYSVDKNGILTEWEV